MSTTLSIDISDFYTIESKYISIAGTHYYRFISLYNGVRGIWYSDRKKAADDGNKHALVILMLYGKTLSKESNNG